MQHTCMPLAVTAATCLVSNQLVTFSHICTPRRNVVDDGYGVNEHLNETECGCRWALSRGNIQGVQGYPTLHPCCSPCLSSTIQAGQSENLSCTQYPLVILLCAETTALVAK
jgi:hypothetical protein